MQQPGDYTITVRSNTGVSKTLTIKCAPDKHAAPQPAVGKAPTAS